MQTNNVLYVQDTISMPLPQPFHSGSFPLRQYILIEKN